MTLVVTDFGSYTNYFWHMDPSVAYLMGSDVPEPEGATIHPIAPSAPVHSDDDKIGFTLDVSMRLDRESEEREPGGVIVPIVESTTEDLADSA
jgi:hypothetical protein